MSAQPAQPVIDTHVILRDGDKILMSQRGSPYGRFRWHMPSGKLDKGEPLSVGAARELYEETDVTVDPSHLRLVRVVHRQQDEEAEGCRPASPNWNSRTSTYACNSRRRTTICPPHGPRPAS